MSDQLKKFQTNLLNEYENNKELKKLHDEIKIEQSIFNWTDYHPKFSIFSGHICPVCSTQLEVIKFKNKGLYNNIIYLCKNCKYRFANDDNIV